MIRTVTAARCSNVSCEIPAAAAFCTYDVSMSRTIVSLLIWPQSVPICSGVPANRTSPASSEKTRPADSGMAVKTTAIAKVPFRIFVSPDLAADDPTSFFARRVLALASRWSAPRRRRPAL